ncbi:MAG: TlpA family protein disulfide reductase [Pirellulales bacterium]|nr:TlpA family protein disulfide reductase [Pirellulales bacterium]
MRSLSAKLAPNGGRLLIVALLALATTGCIESPSKMHQAVGKRLAQIELVPLTGEGQTVTGADLEGKVVLINFWATYCPPCKRELPEIAELQKEYADNDRVVVLAVSLGQQSLSDLRDETAATLEKLRLTLPTYADLRDATWGSYLGLGAQPVVPTTVILDGKGIISNAWTGPATKRELDEAIQTLLKDQG